MIRKVLILMACLYLGTKAYALCNFQVGSICIDDAPNTGIKVSSGIAVNNFWVGGALRSSNTFVTTVEGHLDASTLINPLPAISGALLYAINGAAINGIIPASSIGNAVIANQNTLQAGTSFYVQQGTINGALTVNGSGTAINATVGNIAFPYGSSIIVSPSISWPSGTNTLLSVFFNSVDDEVDYYTPGGTRATPVMSMRSATGRTGFKTTNPGYDLEVNGTMGAQTLTTTSGALNLTIKSGAQIRALTPANQGQYYYCLDCSVVTTCVSTGTALGAWSLITNRGSVCQ
jgi:hypothetical protein